ncbi:hypothetical protein [Sphingomonas sp. DT-204]|uniref:hypothetical protein n=1 Tax=Sphingomonas sp. DT-204 TaxID=3396166 RepID=UPI003F1B91AE
MGHALILLLVAFALRFPMFGNPVIHSDEQFYLLVGDRMLHGALPFVDIWDRKPIGLFLIFAAARRIGGGDGIVACQIAATLSAAGTAWLVACLASRRTGAAASVMAGATYLVWLLIFDGAGAQAPLFYNLAMAGAALIMVDVVSDASGRCARWRGVVAMTLVGIAIQIKYTVVFEGLLFGLALVWRRHRSGAALPGLAGDGALWAGMALLPTLIAFAAYAAAGHGAAFAYANFVSIFDFAPNDTVGERIAYVALAAIGLLPLLACAVAGVRRRPATSPAERRTARFLLLWLGVAVLAVLLGKSFKGHYFLPVLLPLCVAAAPMFAPAGRAQRIEWRIAAPLLLLGLVLAVFTMRDHVKRRGDAEAIGALVGMIGDRPAGCMFGFGAEPILYHLTRSCTLTPYLFRSHLSQTREARAIGVDPLAELRRVLGRCPGTIVVRASKDNTNPAAAREVERAVAERYRLVGAVRVGSLPQRVYRLRPEMTGVCPARGGSVLPAK